MPLPGPIANYVGLLAGVHRDQSVFRHFAEDPNGIVHSTMYLTPFVYQFFIYNSLYQVDWPASIQSGTLTYLSAQDEEKSQAAFEDFVQAEASRIPTALSSAFAYFEALPTLGLWTRVVPDARITEEQGVKFFNDLTKFRSTLRRLRKSPGPACLLQAFSYIRELRLFIYRVRCNIFHGRKSLTEAIEPNQNKRIEVYYRFLNGVVTLFFTVMRP